MALLYRATCTVHKATSAVYEATSAVHKATSAVRPMVNITAYKQAAVLMNERTMSSSGANGPDLPDLNTDVNIHEHKLSRPMRRPTRQSDTSPARRSTARWHGLHNLGENTVGSLIPETLKAMDSDEDLKLTTTKLHQMGQKAMTREERKQRQRALDNLNIPNFMHFYKSKQTEQGLKPLEGALKKKSVSNVGINIGLYCNQACNHCHVESSPKRTEMMTQENADRCLHLIQNSPDVKLVDITGGAPELCTEFRHLVSGSRAMGKLVIDRCNLTSLLEPGQEDTIDFLAQNQVIVVASLPCYTSKNVNQQRGKGVFAKSIQALLLLNEAGYGQPDSGLELHLVYNPLGAFLPPPQEKLRDQYKKSLAEDFGIVFNELYTLTNMPIKRFNDFLYRRNELEPYMDMLVRNFNLNTVDEMMCRDSVTINWDGQIHDCDFNGQLQLSMLNIEGRKPKSGISVWDIDSITELHNHTIKLDNHCFGCSAGMGSS